jgi:hypothetical protein
MSPGQAADAVARHELPTAGSLAVTDNQPVTGSILAVRDCGTLVLVFLDAGDGRTVPVPMEQRAFGWLLEAEGCRPDDLVGRRIRYDGDRILFVDGEATR